MQIKSGAAWLRITLTDKYFWMWFVVIVIIGRLCYIGGMDEPERTVATILIGVVLRTILGVTGIWK